MEQSQVQRCGVVWIRPGRRYDQWSRRVTIGLESGVSPTLGFKSVDWDGVEVFAARVSDMIAAAAKWSSCPGVDEIKNQRCMYSNGRVQAHWRLPGTIAHTGNAFALLPGHGKRNAPAAADNNMAVRCQSGRFDL